MKHARVGLAILAREGCRVLDDRAHLLVDRPQFVLADTGKPQPLADERHGIATV